MSEQAARIQQAIRECDRFIEKESRRLPELRSSDIVSLLAWYIEHRSKLMVMTGEQHEQ